MATDLESLREEIEKYLEDSQVTAFHGFTGPSTMPLVFWDHRRDSDFRNFVATAQKAGARMLVVDRQNFLLDDIDEVREQIEDSELTREEKRSLERRISALQKFEGFTARLELSFCCESRMYIFHKEAEWYRQWEEIVDEVDALTGADDDEEDPGGEGGGMQGYFSAN